MEETQEVQVQSLSLEDPLEEGMATHSSNFPQRIPWTEAWWLTVHRVARSQTWLKRTTTWFSVSVSGPLFYPNLLNSYSFSLPPPSPPKTSALNELLQVAPSSLGFASSTLGVLAPLAVISYAHALPTHLIDFCCWLCGWESLKYFQK